MLRNIRGRHSVMLLLHSIHGIHGEEAKILTQPAVRLLMHSMNCTGDIKKATGCSCVAKYSLRGKVRTGLMRSDQVLIGSLVMSLPIGLVMSLQATVYSVKSLFLVDMVGLTSQCNYVLQYLELLASHRAAIRLCTIVCLT